jgi:hypothetical protein
MEPMCACAYPQAINKCDERYHCDRCGYPLGPTDRRLQVLPFVGHLSLNMLIVHTRGYRHPKHAWEAFDRYSGKTRPEPRPLESSPMMRSFRFRLRVEL